MPSIPTFLPSPEPSAVLSTERDDFHFDLSFVLVRRADPKADMRTDWKSSADHWQITVTQREYGNAAVFDYWTGLGQRALHTDHRGYALGSGKPVAPSASSFLSSIGADANDAEDMPEDDVAALEWLEEQGTAEDVKPAQALRIVRSYRETSAKVASLLANTGIWPADFANWAIELEA